MDLFFTILKFAGVFVSGFGAIIASIPEHRRGKRSEKSKLRQFWHKLSTKQSGLYIAIIGLFVAMLSQFVETMKSSEESKDAQEKFTEQMSVATNSLAELERQSILTSNALEQIQRVATRFDKVSVPDAIFQLPASEPAVSTLSRFLDHCIAQKEADPTNDVWPELGRWTYDHGVASPTGNGELNLYGIKNLASFQSAFKSDTPELKAINTLLKSLLTPVFEILLSKKPLDKSFGADEGPYHLAQPDDFSARGSPSKSGETSLIYSPATKQIFVHWHDFVFPRERWQMTGKIISIQDLGNAHCYFLFYSSALENVRPKVIEADFDNYSITLDKFQTYVSHGNHLLETTLPATETILNGEAYNEIDWP